MGIHNKVEALLAKMTLEEKAAQTDMIRGVTMATKVHPAHFCAVDDQSDFYWDEVRRQLGSTGIGFVHDIYALPRVLNLLQRYCVEETRLGIPCIFTGEALHGINFPGATSFPLPITLGAAFDPELTEEVGRAIAAETRALGIHEILAPNLDLARDPRWGRVEETFGEDTYLAARMARAIVTGEQGNSLADAGSVVCEPKHYLAHGFAEGGLNCAPARAGRREVLSEYLPVFAAGVQAGARCAMAAYHSLDGVPLIASRYYLTEVLKEQLGLQGYIRADFGAIGRLKHAHHLTDNDDDSIALAFNAGLDVQGFDYPNEVWQGALVRLVQSGRIPRERLDDAVRRILRIKFELGLFDHPYVDETRYHRIIRIEKHREVCLRAAREGMTLLKNDGILPLRSSVKSIAVIGPSSNQQRIGSYSSVPWGYQVESVSQALRRKLPDDVVIWQEDGCGISVNDHQLIPGAWMPDGVDIACYADADFTMPPVGTLHTPELNFNWGLAKPHPSLAFHGYGVRMTVKLCPQGPSFKGKLVIPCRDSVRLYLDGQLLIDSWGERKQPLPSVPFVFTAGSSHELMLEYWNDGDGRNVSLAYSAHDENSMQRALTLVEKADLTLLVCGDDTTTSGEGMDRNDLRLFGPQRELVRRAGELGKACVLILEVGKPVDLTDEEPLMNAVLLPWFGGEMGAQAIVETLVGENDPSGRLPISFPRTVGDIPCYSTHLPGGAPNYLEGTALPRYPFGHGLSYTTFAMEHIDACMTGPDTARVTLTIRNTGDLAGVAVPQVYVEDPVSSVVTPDKRLCAFARIPLHAGEVREVTLDLGPDAFCLMNEQYQWVREPGRFILHAGFSVADIRLKYTLE